MAGGYRADAAGFPDDAGAALFTDFIEFAKSGFLAHKQRIQGRDHEFFELPGNGLHTIGAGHDQKRLSLIQWGF